MTIYVFAGPTITPEEVRAELDAVCLPPVAQGDVYRVALRQPVAIGIVDGFFERQPAVWHKEILWAMAQGIHVFGAASMGALRAAELALFGMEGVGEIFAAYRDGTLQDDDEVAVVHGPMEAGYRVASEAMVNIRFTLAKAVDGGVIRAQTRARLVTIAKEQFYPDRTYPSLLRQARDMGLPPEELDALDAWLPGGRVDQKRNDALSMLRLMRARIDGGLTPKQVSYTVEQTVFWDTVVRAETVAGTEGTRVGLLVDELALRGGYASTRDAAMLRHLLLAEAERERLAVDPALVHEVTAAYRRGQGLQDDAALADWLTANGLTSEQFAKLMRDEALLHLARARAEQGALRRLPDLLRSQGRYAAVAKRAGEKERKLQARGLKHAGVTDAGTTVEQMVRWFFDRAGRPIPADLTAFAHAAGFSGRDHFIQALAGEYCFAGGAIQGPGATPSLERIAQALAQVMRGNN